MKRMSFEHRDEIWARHYRGIDDRCVTCLQIWPCDTRLVLDDTAALEWAIRRIGFRRLGTGRKSSTG